MRLIDADRLLTDKMKSKYYHLQNGDIAIPIIDIEHAPTVEAVPVTEKAFEMFETDYKNRLKADLEAILVELQLEIEEIEMDNNVPFGFEPVNKFYEGISASSRVIQQKINELKEDGVIIQDGATNGDIIKAMFPTCKDWEGTYAGEEVHFVQLPDSLRINEYLESWWNAPYERGSEND